MTAISPPTGPAWTLSGLVANRQLARLDLNSPSVGLTVPSADATDHLLGLELRGTTGSGVQLFDHWIRGNDLIAVYRPSDPRRLEATAMWRALGDVPTAWELVLSAQTALVESDGSLAVTCDIAPGHVSLGHGTDGRVEWSSPDAAMPTQADATCILVRRAGDAILVAVHPDDSRRMVVTGKEGRVRFEFWLFSTAIEKGVLHRGRVLAAIGPPNDRSWADALVARLAAAPPPLTT